MKPYRPIELAVNYTKQLVVYQGRSSPMLPTKRPLSFFCVTVARYSSCFCTETGGVICGAAQRLRQGASHSKYAGLLVTQPNRSEMKINQDQHPSVYEQESICQSSVNEGNRRRPASDRSARL